MIKILNLGRYCDGWSFSGNVDAPQTATVTNRSSKTVSNVTVWLRGRVVLDAVIDDLLGVRGMRMATDVVVGGCSAGGMAVYLNCDHWADRIRIAAEAMGKNKTPKVVCLADAVR